MGPIPVVAEAVHQFGPGLGDPAGVPAWTGERGGEAEAGQRRSDDVEGVGGVAAVAGGVGQRADNGAELHDGAGPAVGDDQRQRGPLGDRTCTKWTFWPSMVVVNWGNSF